MRAGRAAHVQLEAVRRLERARRLDELAPPLREIAQLRLKHPSLSLRELGAKCSPAASKVSAASAFVRPLNQPAIVSPSGPDIPWARSGPEVAPSWPTSSGRPIAST